MFAAALAGSAIFIVPVMARDHGVMGQTWPVAEPDLLTTISTRLNQLQANGGIDRMNQQMVDQAKRSINRPPPVAGIGEATTARSWLHDPSIVLDKDIHDHKGQLIAAAGTRVNPLSVVRLRAPLVFIDGDSEAQVKWAMSRFGPRDAKIILVNGAPLDLMRAHQRRFFFDQRGVLSGKFEIQHVPAVVSAVGDKLKVEELPLVRQAAGRATS